MNLNFEVSLTDIGIGLALSGDSESERQEVMDFLLDVDRGMADVDWSVNLITELSVSTAQDMESEGFMDSSILVNMPLPVPGLPDGTVTVPMAVKVADLVRAMAEQTPHLVVQIMANALSVQREAAAKAAEQAKLCEVCGHPAGTHNLPCNDLMATSTSCHACDQAPKTVCVRPGCGHASHLHFGKQGFKEDTCTECSCPGEKSEWPQDPPCTIPCPCEGFEKEA